MQLSGSDPSAYKAGIRGSPVRRPQQAHSADLDKEFLHWSAKRREEETPDREAGARAKDRPEGVAQPLQLAMAQNSAGSGAINQVETSAPTISILRSMMREELSDCVRSMSGKFDGSSAERGT